jgi:hypothetical protein
MSFLTKKVIYQKINSKDNLRQPDVMIRFTIERYDRTVQNKYETKLVKVKIINFPTFFFKKDVHCFPLY